MHPNLRTSQMSETTARPISPIRARMIEDMNVRNFVPATQREYIRAVKKLAAFLGRVDRQGLMVPIGVLNH